MTVYIFDTNSFRVLQSYYPQTFQSFWDSFNRLVQDARVFSVREVLNELLNQLTRPHLIDWVDANKPIFRTPTAEETEFVAQILAVPHFAPLISRDNILKGRPVADPFVIAAGKIFGACVVTEEANLPNAAKIPNVCNHFGIPWTNLEGFLEKERWSF